MNYWPRVFKSEGDKEEDEWWRASLLIYGLNKACSNITASYLKIGDEFTSAIQFRTTSKGDLPHLFCIFCKSELIGTELKTVA